MKKKLVIIPLFILGLAGYGVYGAFFDMDRLPKGDLISEVKSPSGTYTLKAYVSSEGATTDFAVRGELNFNEENKDPKNIYWNDHERTANIKWIDDNTVVINDHELNVPHDTFDFRND